MDFTGLFIQMLIALLIVCAGAVLFLRYLLPRLAWTKKWQKPGYCELISTFGLDAGRTLYLVKVGKKILLLASQGQGLNLISEITPAELEHLEKQK